MLKRLMTKGSKSKKTVKPKARPIPDSPPIASWEAATPPEVIVPDPPPPPEPEPAPEPPQPLPPPVPEEVLAMLRCVDAEIGGMWATGVAGVPRQQLIEAIRAYLKEH